MSTPEQVFHFALPEEWAAALALGRYEPAGLAREGFIHCATPAQIPGVIARHLRGRGARVRLTLDAARLGEALRYDWSAASGDHYPHVYGPIALDAVLAEMPFDPDAA
jgi:uncharacterized protein (DUF952 family)